MVTARAAVIVGAVTVVGALTSCSSQQPQRNAAPSPQPSHIEASSAAATASTSPDASGQLHTEVIVTYRAMWSDMQDAATTADYGSPMLASHTVDPATGQLRRMLLAFHQMGWVAKGEPVPHPTVVSVSASPGGQPASAQIVDCLDEMHWLTYYADTGQLTDDQPGQRYRVTAVMRQGSDGWKVESFEVAAGGSC